MRRVTNTRWIADSNTAFALDLYAELGRSSGNLFFSPYSVSSALSMAMAGAKGTTATEMERTLHLERDDVHQAFQDLRESLAARSDSGPELRIANRLWGQRGLPWVDSFLELCHEHYGAELGVVDFESDPEDARSVINDWCAAETRDRIQDLLPEGTIDESTSLVLTNAIYFKGAWAYPFSEALTKNGPFFVGGVGEAEVPMMWTTEQYGYFETEELQALEMPYAGEEISMVAILPRDRDGIRELEAGLDAELLGSILESLEAQSVRVAFPRFELTSQFGLAPTLAQMGMEAAFGGGADFSGMCEDPVFIGAVVHKAFVEVNEEGTEAAAATAAVMTRSSTSVAPPPIEFVADHPFVFLIRDVETGSVLFLGRLADPRG